MYQDIEKAIKLVKEVIEVSDEEIDKLLQQDFFKDINEKLGGLQSLDEFLGEGIKTSDDLEYYFYNLKEKKMEAGYPELSAFTIVEKMLQSLGFNPYMPLLRNILSGYHDYNIVCQALKKRLSVFLENEELDRFMEIAALYGINILDSYLSDNELKRFIDLANTYEYMMYEDERPAETLLDCDEELQEPVKLAIRMLTYGYSLSKEQQKLLASYTYKLEDIGKKIAGQCDRSNEKIKINLSEIESGNSIDTLLHEMIHALGVKEEGLTEYLTKRLYEKYNKLIDKNTLNRDKELSGWTLFDVPEGINRAAYWEITKKYEKFFSILKNLGIDQEAIQMIFLGIPFKRYLTDKFGDMPQIRDFFEITRNMQGIYYDDIYDVKTFDDCKMSNLERTCDDTVFSFMIYGERELRIGQLTQFMKKSNNLSNTTLGDFVKIEEQLDKILGCDDESVNKIVTEEEVDYLSCQLKLKKDILSGILTRNYGISLTNKEALIQIIRKLRRGKEEDICVVLPKGSERLVHSERSSAKQYTFLSYTVHMDDFSGQLYEGVKAEDVRFTFFNGSRRFSNSDVIVFKNDKLDPNYEYSFDAISTDGKTAYSKELLTLDNFSEDRIITLDTKIGDVIKELKSQQMMKRMRNR